MRWSQRVAALAAGCRLTAGLEIWPDEKPDKAPAAEAVRAPAKPVSARYEHSETFMGQDFFEPFRWSFHTADDPTHGSVDYLGYADAAIAGLLNATSDRVYMGADSKTVIKTGSGRRRTAVTGGKGPRGRPSVRIMSRQTYNGGMFVISLDHMPTGCGVWPAFWMYGEDPAHIWPTWGEFDIIEGVHRDNRTMTTLHTTGDCNQADVHRGEQFTGVWLQGLDRKADNCDVHAKGQWGNQGCSQAGPEGSLGEAFNAQGGGTFAAEWDPAGGHFRTWFWRRGREPSDLKAKQPNPSLWGTPYSFFSLSPGDCNKDHFKDMRLVFDITFCGDFGAPTFMGSCPEIAKKMTCEEFVEQHPESFREAYWSIRGLDVYQPVVETANTEPEEQREFPDAFGRFGVPVDVFGDGKGPTLPPAPPVAPQFVKPQGNPWAPPVTDEVYETEAGNRARLQGHEGADSDLGDAGEAAQAAEDYLNAGAGSSTDKPEYVEPEYLPIAMKAAKHHPLPMPRVAASWMNAAACGLVVASFVLIAGLWRSRVSRSRRSSSLTLAEGADLADEQRYQELHLGVAPIPTDVTDFEP